MRIATVLSAVILATACTAADRDTAVPDTAGGTPATAVAPDTADSLPPDIIADSGGEIDLARLDSLRVEMARVEDALTKATASDRPALLLELGRLKRLYVAPYDPPHGTYARNRESEFMYDEVGGRYVYRGKHLRELISEFPKHDLVDDAAYELTLLPSAGECEGFVLCHVEYRWRFVKDFLREHPTSPYAPRALDRAIAAFDEFLTDVPDLRRETEYYEAKDLPPLLAEFETVTANLPPPLRDRAAAFSARMNQRLGAR